VPERRVDPPAPQAGAADALRVPTGDVVTGEAVVLDLRAASFASRLLGGLLDALALGVLGVLLLLGATALLSASDEAAGSAIGLTLTVFLLIGVPVLVETLSRGRSLGKLVTGLRVVRDDGGPVRFRHCLVRGLLGFFELWATAGSPAILCALVTRRGKRFGDLLAGTYVVRERTGARHVPLPPMPDELAAWARRADIGRLPDATALAARQFLARAPGLHPSSREQLGASLASSLLPLVSPPPPAGTAAERFLVAVLVERRDRELVTLRRQQARVRELSHSLGRGR